MTTLVPIKIKININTNTENIVRSMFSVSSCAKWQLGMLSKMVSFEMPFWKVGLNAPAISFLKSKESLDLYCLLKNNKGQGYLYLLPTTIRCAFERVFEKQAERQAKVDAIFATGNFAIQYSIGSESWSAKSRDQYEREGVLISKAGIFADNVIFEKKDGDISFQKEELGEFKISGNINIFQYGNYARDCEQGSYFYMNFEGYPCNIPSYIRNFIEKGDVLELYKASPFYKIFQHHTHCDVEINGAFVDVLDSTAAFSIKEHLSKTPTELTANSELLRAVCEYKGYEWFCAEIGAKVLDEDVDQYNSPIRLWEGFLPIPNRSNSFVSMRMRFVDVKCPSTKRRYFIPVAPENRNCWAAVASTFKMSEKEYKPTIET